MKKQITEIHSVPMQSANDLQATMSVDYQDDEFIYLNIDNRVTDTGEYEARISLCLTQTEWIEVINFLEMEMGIS